MKQKAEILAIEVGSTITKVNAFVVSSSAGLVNIGQGFSPTSIAAGDVTVGVKNAREMMLSRFEIDLDSAEVFLNSSAAGGLRVTVHGLTCNMTARAAREASLGAGAIIKVVTAGRLFKSDIDEIIATSPNMVLLAGGVDFGAREVVLENARLLAGLDLKIPVIYAGNAAARNEVREIFEQAGHKVHIAPNVFPDVDVLNVEPLRKIIQDEFSAHITEAPGMARLRDITQHKVLPTPGAVLKATELFTSVAGDTVVIDVGGATTDVHSVTDGSSQFADKLVDPEPRAKRTVEGDLGVFVNASNVIELSDDPTIRSRESDVAAIPTTDREREITRWLCRKAVETGVKRHAGVLADLYTPSGRRQVVRGRDLTAIRFVIGTGGALTRVEGGDEIIRAICTGPGRHLLPEPHVKILLDKNYLFSALGTIAVKFPEHVATTFARWISEND